MDYYVTSLQSSVRIEKENFNVVSEILSEYHGKHKEGFFHPEEWMDEATRSLCAAFLRLGWLAEFDAAGDLQELAFVDDQLFDENKWFADIAPFIEKGSYIDMLGEDIEHWRYYFDGQRVECYPGFVEYPGCPEVLTHTHCNGNCECCEAHRSYEPGTTDYEEVDETVIPWF